jgi:hypothetical protein
MALKLTGLTIALAFAFAIGAGLVPLILTGLILFKTLTGNY